MAKFRLASGYVPDTPRIHRAYTAGTSRLLCRCGAAAVLAGAAGVRVRVRVTLGCSRWYACPLRDAGGNGCGDGCANGLAMRCDASIGSGALVVAGLAVIGTSRQPAELAVIGFAFAYARHNKGMPASAQVADLPVGNACSGERGAFPFAAWPTP